MSRLPSGKKVRAGKAKGLAGKGEAVEYSRVKEVPAALTCSPRAAETHQTSLMLVWSMQ